MLILRLGNTQQSRCQAVSWKWEHGAVMHKHSELLWNGPVTSGWLSRSLSARPINTHHMRNMQQTHWNVHRLISENEIMSLSNLIDLKVYVAF